ncbi:MAG: hypothetical protein ABIP51_20600 [Bacteroidia bacterium]
MKKIILSLVILFSLSLNTFAVRNWYFSSSGNDVTGNGTIGTPYASITKLNAIMSSVVAGDSILLKCGDTFFGAISITKSGTSSNPIVVASYGTGAKPIVTGFVTTSGWTSIGGGIYRIGLSAAGANFDMKMITMDGVIQRMGRYPNYNTTDEGWLLYESHSSSGTQTITDNQLTSIPTYGGYNWTGAEVVMKPYSYVLDRHLINSQSSGTLTLAPALDFTGASDGYYGTNDYGYFFQNDLRTLDQLGEWYWKKSVDSLYMYFGGNNPTSYVIKASVINDGVSVSTGYFGGSVTPYDYITIKNLNIDGFNRNGIFSFNNTNIIEKSNTITNAFTGIFGWHVLNNLADSNDISKCLNLGIHTPQYSFPNTITNNKIHFIGQYHGLTGNSSAVRAIEVSGDNGTSVNNSNLTNIQYNFIDTVGYTGIYFNGSNIQIKNNFINYYCNLLDDGGGIYTYADTSSVNRVVDANIVINGIGDRKGRPENNPMTHALYNDGGSRFITWKNNTAWGADGEGVILNDPISVKVDNNTLYKTFHGIDYTRFPGAGYSPYPNNDTITNNIIWGLEINIGFVDNKLQDPNSTRTFVQDFTGFGPIDNNKYINTTTAGPMNIYYTKHSYDSLFNSANVYNGNGNLSYASWKSFSGKDVSSTLLSNSPTNQIYYNPSNSSAPSNFNTFSKKDISGTIYNNSVTVPSWGSIILYDNGLVPIANAGSDFSITLPTSSTTITGSASDPDGTVSSITWSKVSGPTVTITNGSTSTPTISSITTAGTYVFRITVIDNSGATSTDDVILTVNASTGNISPISIVGSTQTITYPTVTSVTLSGNGTDADGTISSHTWAQVSGPNSSTITTSGIYNPTISNLIPGKYVFSLTVVDNLGAINVNTTTINVNKNFFHGKKLF